MTSRQGPTGPAHDDNYRVLRDQDLRDYLAARPVLVAHLGGPPADWSDPVWQALDFQIDHPTLFQYSYASDGTSFNATAVGDLDCDGTFITYTLSGTAENGNVQVKLTEPPPNSD